MFFLFIDLKIFSRYNHPQLIGGMAYEFRENGFFSNNGLSAYV